MRRSGRESMDDRAAPASPAAASAHKRKTCPPPLATPPPSKRPAACCRCRRSFLPAALLFRPQGPHAAPASCAPVTPAPGPDASALAILRAAYHRATGRAPEYQGFGLGHFTQTLKPGFWEAAREKRAGRGNAWFVKAEWRETFEEKAEAWAQGEYSLTWVRISSEISGRSLMGS